MQTQHATTIGTYCATSQVRARYLIFLGPQTPPKARAQLKCSQLCSATLSPFQRALLQTQHSTTTGIYCATLQVRARCLIFLGPQALPKARAQVKCSQMCSATLSSFQRARLQTQHATTIDTYCATSQVRARCIIFLGPQALPKARAQLKCCQLCSATLSSFQWARLQTQHAAPCRATESAPCRETESLYV